MSDIVKDPKLKDQLEKDYESLFTLKYKIESLEQLKDISEKGLGNLKPYLESDPNPHLYEIPGIPTITRDTYSKFLTTNDYTLIEVYSTKCPGCKRLDPLLLPLKDTIQNSTKKVQLVRMDILNEVGFLKDVDKTPQFILYDKKKATYSLISTKLPEGSSEQVDLDDDQ